MPDGIPKHHKLLVLQPLLSLHLQPSITHLVLLSTACPTSLASDQTKGGGRSGVQRTPRFGAREQKIRSDEDTALSKLSPKDPKELPRSSWCDRRALGTHITLPHDVPLVSPTVHHRRSSRVTTLNTTNTSLHLGYTNIRFDLIPTLFCCY